jgi:hypothetical protein
LVVLFVLPPSRHHAFWICRRRLLCILVFQAIILIKMNNFAAGERAGHSFGTSGLPPPFGRKDLGRIF